MDVLTRRFLRLMIISGLMLGAAGARADAGVQLAHTKQCLACHQVDARRVGPAFTVIADRYAEAPGAHQYLADAIRQGSRSKWGAIPMPAQPHVEPVDAAQLASWILSLADQSEP